MAARGAIPITTVKMPDVSALARILEAIERIDRYSQQPAGAIPADAGDYRKPAA